jgi:hypothetical protein
MLTVVTILGLISLVPVLLTARHRVAATTLQTAWRWTGATVVCWLGAWIAEHGPTPVTAGISDQLWYGVAVLMLCPPIAVLGAKRPMSRVWGWFILLPLMLVFGWPAMSVWGTRFRHAGWILEEPVLVGYVFVLVMGIGNYAGTRHAIGGILWGVAAVLLVLPLCPSTAARLSPAVDWRTIAAWCLIAGGWFDRLWQRHTPLPEAGLDRVWVDFRNDFGLVWGRRIQERFNEFSRRSNLPAVLTPTGLTTRDGAPLSPAHLSEDARLAVEGTLRWLLRRFVDPEWIDARR